MKKRNIFFVVLFFATAVYKAQPKPDSLNITLPQAEKIFSEKNLQLIAAKYNISASKAAEIQSGLWSNPTFSIEQNIYNKETRKYFDFTQNGNTDFAIDQLIVLGGKRSKQVSLAQLNSKMVENNYYDLLRNLEFQLRTDFYKLFFYRQSLIFYNETIPVLKSTINISESGYEKKLILLSELIRLKSLLLSLENEKLDLITKIEDTENELCLFFQVNPETKPVILPVLNSNFISDSEFRNLPLDTAIQTAKENRPDLQNSKLSVEYEKMNLSLQKAMAVPDITIGGRYSRNGNYIPDYTALAIQIDLPFFNRNQGNIEVSEMNLESKKQNELNSELGAVSDVVSAYNKALQTDRLFNNYDKNFSGQYKSLLEGITLNYQRRNITTIEFTDFLESYRNTMVQINQLYLDRLSSFEELNLAVGKIILNTSLR